MTREPRRASGIHAPVTPAGHRALTLAAEHHTSTVYKGRAGEGRVPGRVLNRLVADGYLDPIHRGSGPLRRIVGGFLNADGRRRLIDLDAAAAARPSRSSVAV